jgi:hypothetical protein
MSGIVSISGGTGTINIICNSQSIYNLPIGGVTDLTLTGGNDTVSLDALNWWGPGNTVTLVGSNTGDNWFSQYGLNNYNNVSLAGTVGDTLEITGNYVYVNQTLAGLDSVSGVSVVTLTGNGNFTVDLDSLQANDSSVTLIGSSISSGWNTYIQTSLGSFQGHVQGGSADILQLTGDSLTISDFSGVSGFGTLSLTGNHNTLDLDNLIANSSIKIVGDDGWFFGGTARNYFIAESLGSALTLWGGQNDTLELTGASLSIGGVFFFSF